jgi:hypothetical protein
VRHSDTLRTMEIRNIVGQSQTLQSIGIGALILAFGFRLLTNLKSDSPLSPYAVQIFALIVILPVVLTLALTAKFPVEAVTGLLGTIVGFFFGGAQRRTLAPPQRRGRITKAQADVADAAEWNEDGLPPCFTKGKFRDPPEPPLQPERVEHKLQATGSV